MCKYEFFMSYTVPFINNVINNFNKLRLLHTTKQDNTVT